MLQCRANSLYYVTDAKDCDCAIFGPTLTCQAKNEYWLQYSMRDFVRNSNLQSKKLGLPLPMFLRSKKAQLTNESTLTRVHDSICVDISAGDHFGEISHRVARSQALP